MFLPFPGGSQCEACRSYYPVLTHSAMFACHLDFPASSGVGLSLGWWRREVCWQKAGTAGQMPAALPRNKILLLQEAFSPGILYYSFQRSIKDRRSKFISEVGRDTGSLFWGEM